MCWPMAIGLALAAGGYVAADAGKQRAVEQQRRVLGNAMKDNTNTRNANRTLLMGEAAKEGPSNVAAEQSGAAGQDLSAQNTGANDAVRLFEGGGGNSASASRVLAGTRPRFAASAQLAGVGQGRQQLTMQADRTNAQMDANNSDLNRRLGLVPLQMETAANSGAGLAALGAGLGAAGNGAMSYGMNQPANGAQGQTYEDPYAGAGTRTPTTTNRRW